MTRKEYDKLVRDLIPDIIRQHGSTCGVERLDEDEAFRGALRAKLLEEAEKPPRLPTQSWQPSWPTCWKSLTRSSRRMG